MGVARRGKRLIAEEDLFCINLMFESKSPVLLVRLGELLAMQK
jgi:hypothetical protein